MRACQARRLCPAHHTEPAAREDVPARSRFSCYAVQGCELTRRFEGRVERIRRPCGLKTAGFGYDGKGQTKITNMDRAEAVLDSAGQPEVDLESRHPFTPTP